MSSINPGCVFAFVPLLNEYSIAYTVTGFTIETFPIKNFSSLRHGYTPIMAVASLPFALLAVMVYGAVGVFGNLPRVMGSERAGGSVSIARKGRMDFCLSSQLRP